MITLKFERVNKEQAVPSSNPFTLNSTSDLFIQAKTITVIDLGIKVTLPSGFFISQKIHPNLYIINIVLEDTLKVLVYSETDVNLKKGEPVAKIHIVSNNETYRFLEIVDGVIIRFGDNKNTMREV